MCTDLCTGTSGKSHRGVVTGRQKQALEMRLAGYMETYEDGAMDSRCLRAVRVEANIVWVKADLSQSAV